MSDGSASHGFQSLTSNGDKLVASLLAVGLLPRAIIKTLLQATHHQSARERVANPICAVSCSHAAFMLLQLLDQQGRR